MPQNRPTTPARDDQILSLLNKLGDQLIRSEQDRAQLSQKLILLEAQQQEQASKLEQTQKLSQKVDSALAGQNRKIEQVSQDKVRLIRKLERIEEAVVETREALQSKALVLLTDQSAAARSGQPQFSADPSHALLPPINTRWRSVLTTRSIAIAAAILSLLLLSGWAISHLPFTDDASHSEKIAANAMPPQPLPTVAEMTAATKSPMTQTASVPADLNDLTPSSGPIPAAATSDATKRTMTPSNYISNTTQSDASAKTSAPTKSSTVPQTDAEIETFMAQQRVSGPLSARAHPDPTLPALARQIEKKAFDGVAEAQHDMAAIYTAGHAGVKPDYQRAAFWFGEAALGGIANARYNLGVLYQQGLGVPKDLNRALGWYAAAAKLGHPEAEYNLGIAYVEGVGAVYDPQRAARFFEQAAQGGVVEAAYNLGLVEENGLLGAPNKPEALYWYKQAADRGSNEGKVALNQLSHSMNLSPADIDKLVSDIHPHGSVTTNNTMPLSPINAAPANITTTRHAAAHMADKQIAATKPMPLTSPLTDKESADAVFRQADPAAADSAIVAQIQEQLMKRGLFPGPADGSENAVTKDAILAYQAANNLPSDGRASQSLLVNLLGAQSATPPIQSASNVAAADTDNGDLRPDDRQPPAP